MSKKTEEKKLMAISLHTGQITHREFAINNGKFIAACDAANVKPTQRQASKWRKKRGKAWKNK